VLPTSLATGCFSKIYPKKGKTKASGKNRLISIRRPARKPK
jgi:hypothetical protein